MVVVVEGSSPSNSTGDMMASEIAAAACWERGSEEEVHSSHLRWSHAVLSIFLMFECLSDNDPTQVCFNV